MPVQLTVDQGQPLASPEGRVIGFVDTKEQFNAVTTALRAAGYADAIIIALYDEDGIEMLKRQQKEFFFGDGEDALIQFAIKELQKGHYGLGIEVHDRAIALQVVELIEPLGAHSFSYFGSVVNERLTL